MTEYLIVLLAFTALGWLTTGPTGAVSGFAWGVVAIIWAHYIEMAKGE